MTLQDPQPGDGSLDPADPTTTPVPGGLEPGRTEEQEAAIDEASAPHEVIDPQDSIDAARFPVIHRLAAGLAEDHYADEFEAALEDMLDRVAARLA